MAGPSQRPQSLGGDVFQFIQAGQDDIDHFSVISGSRVLLDDVSQDFLVSHKVERVEEALFSEASGLAGGYTLSSSCFFGDADFFGFGFGGCIELLQTSPLVFRVRRFGLGHR